MTVEVNAQADPVSRDQSSGGGGKGGQGTDLVSVNPYNGIGSVHIPIYSYAVEEVNLPVSLSYDCNGIGVSQIAGEVGLNWNLLAGATITRRACGIEDELLLQAPTFAGPNAYYTYCGGNHDTCPKAQQGAWVVGYDGGEQQDLFTLNLGGQSYDFNMRTHQGGGPAPNPNPTGVSIIYPVSDLRIEVLVNNLNNTPPTYDFPINQVHLFNPTQVSGKWNFAYATDSNVYPGFLVTDDKGNEYWFDRGDYEYRTTDYPPQFINQSYWVTTRWVIKRIRTASGQVINFTYKKVNESFWVGKEQVVEEELSGPHPVSKVNLDRTIMWHGIRSYVTGIELANGEVVKFFYQAGGQVGERCDGYNSQCLSRVEVSQAIGSGYENKKSYKFNYAYYNSNGSIAAEIPYNYTSTCQSLSSTYGLSDPSQIDWWRKAELRLKLKSIDVVGNDGTTVERLYTFDYNDASRLPNRYSFSSDYYGYYNGNDPAFTVTGNIPSTITDPFQNLGVPRHTIDVDLGGTAAGTITYGVDKAPNFLLKQTGILKAITNGTRGRIEISYQDHLLSNPPYKHTRANQDYYPTDALATTPLTDFSLIGLATDYEGSDANDGLCIGKLTFYDGFTHANDYRIEYDYETGLRFLPGMHFWVPIHMYGGTVLTRYYSNQAYTPLRFNQGANHGYSTVTVKTSSGSTGGTMMSKEKMEFLNSYDWNTSTQYLTFMAPYNYDSNFNAGIILSHSFIFRGTTDHMMGLLLKTSSYNSFNILKSTTENVYRGVDHFSTPTSTKLPNWLLPVQNYIGCAYSMLPNTAWRLQQTTTTGYSGSSSSTISRSYTYTPHDFVGSDPNDANAYRVESITTGNSRGESIMQKFFYAHHPMPAGTAIPFGYPAGRAHMILAQTWKDDGNGARLIGATYNQLGYDYVSKITRTAYTTALRTQAVAPTSFNGSYLTKTTENLLTDQKGNVLETRLNDKEQYEANVWNSLIGKKVATVSGAQYADIAFTSFEGPFQEQDPNLPPDPDRGNWNFSSSFLVQSPAGSGSITGRYWFVFDTHVNDPVTITSVNALKDNKKYLLSFWATNLPTVGLVDQASSLTPVTMTQQDQVGPWKLYTAVISNSSQKIAIVRPPLASNSEDIRIDELRLHPLNAAMTTCTYEPLFGASSQCDARNNITYFEYDAMGRLKVTRDLHGNIINLTRTVVDGSDN